MRALGLLGSLDALQQRIGPGGEQGAHPTDDGRRTVYLPELGSRSGLPRPTPQSVNFARSMVPTDTDNPRPATSARASTLSTATPLRTMCSKAIRVRQRLTRS